MKILFINHGTILAGAPLSLLYLTRELEKRPEVDLEVVCHAPLMRDFFAGKLNSPVNLWVNPHTLLGKILIGWSSLKTRGATRQFIVDLLSFPVSIWRQMRLIQKRKPDLVHLNSATLFSSAIAARLAGIPVIWHIREPLQGKEQLVSWVGRFIRTKAAAVITISEEEAVRLGQDDEKKVHVVYNPINVETLRPELYDQEQEKQKLGFRVTDKLVLSLGGVNARKGTLELVESMQWTDPETYMLIAGPPLPPQAREGTYEHRIIKALEKLPEGKVTFPGNLENIVPLLAACDLLIFAGMKPHFPRPVYEAWQMHKPVIVFGMKGVSNQVEHGVNGIVVRELTGKALGLAIAELLDDPSARACYGQAGRQKAERMCNPASVALQVLDVYRKVLGRSGLNSG